VAKEKKTKSYRSNPYKDVIGITGYVAGKFPETVMDIEDAIGFGKLYESGMKSRGKKSLKRIDEDYSGIVEKAKGGKVGRGCGAAMRGAGKVMKA
jgi:hypothetical protein